LGISEGKVSTMLEQKPIAMRKLISYFKSLEANNGQVGTNTRGLQLNYCNICNFKCEHCFTASPTTRGSGTSLTVQDVSKFCDELDELGGWEIDIQGGEPLLLPSLPEVIKAMRPERFYVFITTNGWLMTPEKAQELKELQIDRITVSIDSFSDKEHDSFRGQEGALARAKKALQYAQEAGMTANVNATVGHYNAKSKDLEGILEFASEHNYNVSFNAATPTGNWQNNHDIVLTEEDTEYIEHLKEKYNLLTRDLWNARSQKTAVISGCTSVNVMYINPNGDVLPCPYIHTRIGNVKEQSLIEISQKGYSVKHFHDYSAKCLAGEDMEFIKKYLGEEMSVMQPVDVEKLFPEKEEWL